MREKGDVWEGINKDEPEIREGGREGKGLGGGEGERKEGRAGRGMGRDG